MNEQRNTDLLKIIQEKQNTFSKGQKQISSFILAHYDKAAYMTAAKLGALVGVSESTVVRFANELGFAGYPELQHSLQEMIRSKLTTIQRIEITNDRIGESDLLEKVLNSDIDKIKHTLEEIDRTSFENAVDDLIGAQMIYIIGMRSSSSLASFMYHYLNLVFPRFDMRAIGIIAPISIVTCVEHVGDVYANGAVVGKDFTKDPGLHKTMLGDGLATLVAGLFGGPANTTYSENTAVLAATGNYNPVTLRVAALIAIVISFLGKAIGVVETVPNCVLGGACIVLYGMISSVGLRTLVEEHVDFTKNRNLCLAAVMLVLAMGGAVIGGPDFSFSGIGLGIIVGILLNLVLPEKKNDPDGKGLVAHVVPENEIVKELEK